MFEHLTMFNRIVISGPQRSGTRIAAKIVASDTNKDYIDEKDINFQDFRLLEWYLAKDNVVIQCPGLCHKLHEIMADSTLIIVVRRPIVEIIASERRIGWNDVSEFPELIKYGYTSGIISRIKYDYWDTIQKPILIDRWGEINYHELDYHPLFKTDRSSFLWNQTE